MRGKELKLDVQLLKYNLSFLTFLDATTFNSDERK
jgi:hypothetical protein